MNAIEPESESKSEPERLVWCDLETTGLDPNNDLLLEVGFRITDLELNTLSQKSVLIWGPKYIDKIVQSKIEHIVWNMHKESQLFVDAKEHGTAITAARDVISNWLVQHDITVNDPICGSSVQFDRGWLDVWMPECINMFSYRNIDTSSIKEVCRRYNPVLYAKLDEDTSPKKLHRVQSDLTDTINEFKFYRDNFFFWRD